MSDNTALINDPKRVLQLLDRYRRRIIELEEQRHEPIAIVGMGCRLPGGVTSPEELWRLLAEGVDAVTDFPPDRAHLAEHYDPDSNAAGKMCVRQAAFLSEPPDRFDAQFFGISPREAANIDPQHRLLLEVGWEALEQAGVVPSADVPLGVFVGIGSSEYGMLQRPIDRLGALDPYTSIGTLTCFSAGRLSYLLGVHGPSVAVDTACSSSLVAIHLACQSLRAGECSVALAGGVQLMLSPVGFVSLTRIGALAPDGRCKTFSADANGMGRGEGCGMIVLKRLADAQRDRDRVLAVIRGSAANHDGRSSALTVPNGQAQRAVLRQALASARLTPHDIDYVEAHGTGTSLGDPIEVEALAAVFAPGRAGDRRLQIGSVKTNIGHLESAAGVAGLMKVVLALQHEALPAHLHAAALNPHILWERMPISVTRTAEAWPRDDRPRRAGVSSFGLSGTNAHVIVEEAPASNEAAPQAASSYLLSISARSEGALRELARSYERLLLEPSNNGSSLSDITYTASVRRSHHERRLAVTARSRDEMVEALSAWLGGEMRAGVAAGEKEPGLPPKVVFVFPGQGSQWLGMGRQLLDQEPVFRAAIEACDRAIAPEAGWSLLEELRADAALSRYGEIDVVQPALFAIEVALAALLRSWGLEPDAVVGHSMGEVAAAHVAGALTLEDAARVICRRSRLLRKANGRGAMALVELPIPEAQAAIRPYEGRISIGGSNSTRATVLSGELAALEALLSSLHERGVFCRVVKGTVPSHGPRVDFLLPELRELVSGVQAKAGTVPIYSTVTGRISDGSDYGAEHWLRNLREPVMFSQAIHRLLDDGHQLFVEVSPHPILLAALEEGLRDKESAGVALASLRRDQDERRALLESLGTLYARGYPVDWKRLFPSGGRCVSLPTYPWQRERYWMDDDPNRERAPRWARALGEVASGHPLLGAPLASSVHEGVRFWETALRLEALPYLSDHRVKGDVVLPGSAYLEMALSAGIDLYGPELPAIEDLAIERALTIPPSGAQVVQLVLTEEPPDAASFRIMGLHGDSWVQHAAGRLRGGERLERALPSETRDQVQARCTTSMTGATMYQRASERGVSFGPSFQGVQELWVGRGEVLGRVSLPAGVDAPASDYQLHPAFLDACFQVLAALSTEPELAAPGTLHMLVGVDEARVYRRPGRDAWVHGRLAAEAGRGGERLAGELRVLDEHDQIVIEARGLRFQRLSRAASAPRKPHEEWLYAIEWQRRDPATALPAAPSPGGTWLIFTDLSGTGDALAALLESRGDRCVWVLAGELYERLGPGRYRINRSDEGALADLLRDALAGGAPCRGVVHLWSLDAPGNDAATPAWLRSDGSRACLSAACLARALVRAGWRDTPRLWLVTRGAQAAGAEPAAVAVPQAPLWGVGRVLSMEHPELRTTLVDLSPTRAAAEATALAHELAAEDREDQIALRSEGRYVARLVRTATRDAPAPAPRFHEDGTYLITGALGGLGLEIARWMAARGARQLAIVDRRLPESAAQAVSALEDSGVRVALVEADVSRDDELAMALSELALRLPPIRGVVHAAGIDDEAPVVELDPERFGAVMAQRAQAAWNLHAQTLEQPLDIFVLCSTVSALLGLPGRAGSAAADAFLDALARHRRSLGRCGLSISWGPRSGSGPDAAHDEGGALHARGLGSFTQSQAVEVLDGLLPRTDAQVDARGSGSPGGALRPEPQVGVLQLDLRQWLEAHPSAARSLVWSELRSEGERAKPAAPAAARLRKALEGVSPTERLSMLERHAGEQVGRVLRKGASTIDRSAAFSILGMDSMMGLELRNRLETSLGIRLPATLLFMYPNLASLAEHLVHKLDLPANAGSAVTSKPADERRAKGPSDGQARSSGAEPIAVIGIACRYPGGATDPEALWQALKRGVDAVKELPAGRWPADAIPEGQPGTRWAGLLDVSHIETFDASFFGIAPREARSMDPQQRLLLEVAWEALEDAGMPADRLMGSPTGVFIGMNNLDYQKHVTSLDLSQLDLYAGMGTASCTSAGRLSYVLGLQGPCMFIDTACSTSLVATHLACQSLRAGESDMALAGGANLILSPVTMYLMAQMQALSPDGRCKTFDVGANGFVRAEGCGAVVLKRLSDAERDGDRIWAVLRGSAVNQDGRSSGLTAPNVLAQQEVLRQALASAGVAPWQLSYVEAHGTGTPLGDPIELEALKEVVGQPRPDGSVCVLGSAKPNLGHTEAASGMAGLIKVIMAMHHELIPRQLHFQALNPRISLDGTPFVIPKEELPWKRGSSPRIAGVSAFGVSGTNAHVVVQEPPLGAAITPAPAGDVPALLLPLSAKSARALTAAARSFRDFLAQGAAAETAALNDVAYTAAVRRAHHEHRLAVVGRSRDELIESLDAFLRGETRPSWAAAQARAGHRPKLVFVFPGQGSQWVGMGRGLLETEPVFRSAIQACDQEISKEAGWSLIEELKADEGQSRLSEIDVLQPALFAFSVALAALWRSWGVEADALVGHSMGEVAAAHVAGVLTLEDAARVICRRSRLMRRMSGKGAIGVVGIPLDDAAAAIGGHEDRVSVAGSNSPTSTVLSGDADALKQIFAALTERQVVCRWVKVDVASHSPQMDPLLDELRATLQGIEPAAARLPLLSTVTTELCRGPELGAEYWARNLRDPVLFWPAIEQLRRSDHTLFLELSPHPVLVPAVDDALVGRGGGVAIGSLRRAQDDLPCLLQALGALHTQGYPVDFRRLFPNGGRVVSLPSYPWQRERHWLDGAPPRERRLAAAGGHPLLGARVASARTRELLWQITLDRRSLTLLHDEAMRGLPVVPASVVLDLALSAAAQVWRASTAILASAAFESLWVVSGDRTVAQLVFVPESDDRFTFELFSERDERGSWQRIASGEIQRSAQAPAARERASLTAIRARCREEISSQDDLARLRERGLHVGEAILGVGRIWRRAGEALGRLRLPEASRAELAAFRVPPPLLEAAMRVLAAALPNAVAPALLLADRVESLRLQGNAAAATWSHALLRAQDDDGGCTGDVHLLDEDGHPVLELTGLRLCPAGRELTRLFAQQRLDDWLYETVWQTKPRAAARAHAEEQRRFLLLADGGRTGEALASVLEARGHAVHLAVAGSARGKRDDGKLTFDPTRDEDFAWLLAEVGADARPLAAVVHLMSLDASAAEELTVMSLRAAQDRGCSSIPPLVRALLSAARSPGHPALWLITRGAQPAAVLASPLAVAQAPLWAMGRVLSLEHPELWGGMIDLDPVAPPAEAAQVADEILAPDGEDHLAFRAGERRIARVRRGRAQDLAGAGAALRPDASYLVTGGLGNLGLKVARFMARAGARHLVLTSRKEMPGRDAWPLLQSDPAYGAAIAAIAEIERLGVAVRVVAADVLDAERMGAVLAQCSPPLRGIVHAAAAFHLGPIVRTTREEAAVALAPKVEGSWILHEKSRALELDFLVFFSSAAAMWGSAQQGVYAAANHFMDALAHHRRALGMPAVSVNWGAWEGSTTISDEAQRLFAQIGFGMMPADEAIAIFGQLLGDAPSNLAEAPRVNLAIAAVDWSIYKPVFEAKRRRPLLELMEAAPRGGEADEGVASPSLSRRLASADAQGRLEILTAHVQARVMEVLGIKGDASIEHDSGFFQLGMDSLMSVQLRRRLEADLGRSLPATLAFEHPTLRALTTYLAHDLDLQVAQAAEPPPEPPAPLDEEAPEGAASEDELIAALAEELAALKGEMAK